MKFLYGYDNNFIDITDIVFKKCVTSSGIFIPPGDNNRCDIVGYDPYPNILKYIIVIDNFNNNFQYNYNREVNISFNNLTQELNKNKNPKNWWTQTGRFISDPIERLNALHKHINLHYIADGGAFELEYPEQLMCMRYIKEDDKVLEIGGNVGRTAHIIHTILRNPHNHIVMEIDQEMAKKLRYNLDLNTYNTLQIETAALSASKLYNLGGNPRPVDDDKVTPDMIQMPTISYSEICKKYNVDFNVLVADCEGSLFYIFKEDPDMLDNIHTVIMENDYYDIDHKQMVDAILKLKGFTMVYQEKGVPWASWSCCYEYFYEVWKKE
jgi:FkbM family methyltransferase